MPVLKHKITPAQGKAIRLTAQGLNKTDVAKQCGVSRQTLYDWFSIPDIRAEITKERESVVNETRDQLRALLPLVPEMMKKVILNPDNKSLAKITEMLLKSTKLLDEKPSNIYIILQSSDPFSQVIELKKLIADRISNMSDGDRMELMKQIQGNAPAVKALPVAKDVIIDD